MRTDRVTGLLMTVVFVFAPFASTPKTHAQEKKATNAQEKKELEQVLRRVLPQDAGGTPIEDAETVRACVVALAGFILVYGLTWILVRVLAYLVIAAWFLGGLVLAYWLLYEKYISTWEQLLVATLWIGVTAGIMARTAYLYALENRASAAPYQSDFNQSLAATVKDQSEAIARLTLDVQALREKLAEKQAIGH